MLANAASKGFHDVELDDALHTSGSPKQLVMAAWPHGHAAGCNSTTVQSARPFPRHDWPWPFSLSLALISPLTWPGFDSFQRRSHIRPASCWEPQCESTGLGTNRLGIPEYRKPPLGLFGNEPFEDPLKGHHHLDGLHRVKIAIFSALHLSHQSDRALAVPST